MTRICVSKFTIIGSDNGLSPSRRQAIIWTNAGVLLIRPSGTNFSEILIEIDVFSFKNMHLKMSSAKWRPFRLGLNVLIPAYLSDLILCHNGLQLLQNENVIVNYGNDDNNGILVNDGHGKVGNNDHMIVNVLKLIFAKIWYHIH